TMQMIEVRMRDQHQVDRRQVVKLHSGLPQPLQNKQPARKVGVNDDVLPADLHKKAGMADKSQPQLTVRNQPGLVASSGTRSYRRMPEQTTELPCPAP